MKRSKRKPQMVATPEQRRVLSSPIRLEILGHFTAPDGVTVADIAERMGRPASALYYHIRMLEGVGLVRRVGERPGTKRAEALYDMVADRIAYPTRPGAVSEGKEALKVMSTAFRMAERDLEAALASRSKRTEGKNRNFFASRIHCRASKSTLAKVNKLLRELDNIVTRESHRDAYSEDATEFFSLTIALLPLRGRESQ